MNQSTCCDHVSESRLRKSCPHCGSVYINRRKKHRQYVCKHCNAIFLNPAIREYKITNIIPRCLIILMEKRKAKNPEVKEEVMLN
jgi:predicted RNA-binding Zn-ribbon protein involved in translation (DUF1610 family)